MLYENGNYMKSDLGGEVLKKSEALKAGMHLEGTSGDASGIL